MDITEQTHLENIRVEPMYVVHPFHGLRPQKLSRDIYFINEKLQSAT